MLERMESPKLRSFEEVPYVEMDHRHAPKQPETFGKAGAESHLSRTLFFDQSRDWCNIWRPLARSFNKLSIEFSRVNSM
jgi:hypothetical protein